MKKTAKITGIVLATPVVLFLLLAALFYFPPFQNWAVKQVASIASEKTGMEITVEHVNLSFPLDLAVDGVRVIKPNDSIPQQKDTVADIKRTVVGIQLLPLFKKQVEVDLLDIQSAKFNTVDFVDAACVKGFAEKLQLKSHGIDLKSETVKLDEVLLDGGDFDIQLNDSVPEDTTESTNKWKIALQQLQIKNTNLHLTMPGDSLRMSAYVGNADVSDGLFDLGEGLYQISRTDLAGCRVNYDQRYEPSVPGFDYNHLALTDVTVGVDSLRYLSPDLYLKVRNASFREKNGLALRSLSGAVKMDSTTLYIPRLTAETTDSHLQLGMTMDLNAFDAHTPGQIAVKGNAQLGKNDVMLFMTDTPKNLQSQWPRYPLAIEADVDGTMRYLNINRFTADLPSALKASAKGYVSNVLEMKNLLANVDLDVTTYNVDFLTNSFLDKDLRKMIRIPSGVSMKGKVFANGSNYDADLRLSQGGGYVALKGKCNTNTMTYNADITARSFPVQRFLPGMHLSPFSGTVKAVGSGTDMFSPRTRLHADAKIDSFHYADFDLSGTTAKADVSDGKVKACVRCVNSLLNGDIDLDAMMDLHNIKATIACSLDKADFYGMKLTKNPLSTSLCAHVDVASDLKDYYKVDGFVSDVVIRDSASIFRPEELQVDILTRVDTTWAKVSSGDMHLDLAASGGYKVLMNVADNLTNEFQRQFNRKYIDQDSLKLVLPEGHLDFHSGPNNMLARYADRMDYVFRKADAHICTSPVDGINGFVQVDSLVTAGYQLDKIRLDLVSDEDGFKYKGQIKNEKDNPQYCFNALFDGSLFETGSDINVALYDKEDKLGIKMGLRAMLEQNGIRVKLADTNAVLGYRNFTANADNFVFLADDKRVSANMLLKAADGTGLQIYSDDDNLDALQDITLGINHLDLASIVSIIPYFPQVKGILNGDFHMIQTEEHLSVSSSLGIDALVYEGYPMGDLSSEFVYMPLEDGSHYVDGMLMHNGKDVGTIKGKYTPSDGGDILDADADLARLPLDLVNGFIPDQIIGLRGFGDGKLRIHGPLDKMDINGVVELHEAYLVSVPYGVELRFDDCPVKIQSSRMVLNDFKMYSHNDQPLDISGNVDFSSLENIAVSLDMKARNFLVIDSKEQRKSEVFGKTFINFDARVKGPLTALAVNGKVDVLGSTDMTYIMRDTPLTTDNRLAELVTFTDLHDDEVENVVERPTIEGLSMDLSIAIDQGARILCALNANKTNYLDIIGGGNLRLIYKSDEMRLNGRYTISEGEMKYSLPVIPLKTFVIQNGSYVEFTGEVMNPTLNITAVEENHAAVSVDGVSRSVLFLCGVVITKTLNDMGLEFIINAPEDMTVNGQLQTMSVEERGKAAVTMLTTGMYLTDGNTSSFTMNNALSSFLQSEINNITGNALRTLDLSIGLDNTTDAAGVLHTDYAFKFAKRFWNNRISVVVGGKVSTTDAINQSLFNNVSLEYRLDQSANTNLKLFYDRAKYDYLEGYVGQYGVGIAWKRKLQSLADIFRFKGTSSNAVVTQPSDSLSNAKENQNE